jgi:hypothetical protein
LIEFVGLHFVEKNLSLCRDYQQMTIRIFGMQELLLFIANLAYVPIYAVHILVGVPKAKLAIVLNSDHVVVWQYAPVQHLVLIQENGVTLMQTLHVSPLDLPSCRPREDQQTNPRALHLAFLEALVSIGFDHRYRRIPRV